jgi:hypothetical protein
VLSGILPQALKQKTLERIVHIISQIVTTYIECALTTSEERSKCQTPLNAQLYMLNNFYLTIMPIIH